MMNKKKNEEFSPVSNNPPGNTIIGKLRFFIRTVLDMQVASVYRDLRFWLKACRGTVLEVGCGAQPYRHLVPSNCLYIGLDWEQAEAHFDYRLPNTIYYNGEHFPFKDNSFDYLFHTEVLEHIYHAGQFLAECRRVLKPTGRMFFSVPFQARYHYIPHDFFRYTPAALERILSEAGFHRIVIRPRGNDITVAAYKNISIIYRWMRLNPVGLAVGILLFPIVVAILVVGQLSMHCSIGSPDDCLGFTVTTEDMSLVESTTER
jgi:SAM-dependent methyltransferase